jgi:hypothetical protein
VAVCENVAIGENALLGLRHSSVLGVRDVVGRRLWGLFGDLRDDAVELGKREVLVEFVVDLDPLGGVGTKMISS